MKLLNNRFFLIALLLSGTFFACEDEELKERNFPGWETGVNGFGQVTSTATNFLLSDVANGLDFDFRWISIDEDNTVSSISFYVTFNEEYLNPDGDPAIANHGTVLFMTNDSPPANREDMSLSISQTEMYDLFSGATFDYDEDGTAESVWTYAPKGRNVTTSPFVDGDDFLLTWELTTEDGRVFDSWSPSVCTELPGSNCEISWILECGQIFNDPRGIYSLAMQDSYGDGWNGAFITVSIDGTDTDYVLDDYDLASASVDIPVPASASSLSFAFTGGDWDSEITYQVTSEHGNTIISDGPSPDDGPITLNLCLENAAPASTVP